MLWIYFSGKIYQNLFYTNLEENSKCIEVNGNIVDFIQLENENLCILMDDKIYIYNIKDYEFKIEKEINYNINNDDFGFHNIKHIMNNNIAFLSSCHTNIINLNILKYPDYKIEKINIANHNFYFSDFI